MDKERRQKDGNRQISRERLTERDVRDRQTHKDKMEGRKWRKEENRERNGTRNQKK